MIEIPQFADRKELFDFLVVNKSQLVAQKKFEMKRADAFAHSSREFAGKGEADKAASVADLLNREAIDVKAIINTTGLLDSHGDVHIPGLWKKTLKERRSIYLLQEHRMAFDHVISSEVKASAKQFGWSDLGLDFKGTTEALVFDAHIEKSRNPYMFEQYARGYVKNHSVGMQYVILHLCIDDAEYKTEKSNWDTYAPHVVNLSEAEERGYFWAVTEAKVIEGSAVVMGSNWATPTQAIKSSEPPAGTPDKAEPVTPLVRSVWEELGKTL